MRRHIYSRTIEPFTDLASVFLNGLYKRYATFPCQDANYRKEAVSLVYKAPCETTRQSAKRKLETIKQTSKSPIVKGLAHIFSNN